MVKKTLDETSINSLCGRCVRRCRQSACVVLVDCPRFLPRPFKIAEHRYDQLDLFSEKKS